MTPEQIIEHIRERDDGEIMALIKSLAKAFHVTVDELLSKDKGDGPCQAREALWWHLYETGLWSYPRIGKLLGRDHSTVMSGVRAHCIRNGIEFPQLDRGVRVRPRKLFGQVGMSCANTLENDAAKGAA